PAERNGPRGPRHRRLQTPVACAPCWGKRCPTGHFVCMEAIEPGAVVAAAEALLAAADPR
ncbi:MAG: glycosyltransferase family 9 protein, partial [Nitrospirae bacterium]